ELHRARTMRLAFKDGFYWGGVKAALMTLTGGRVPGSRIPMEPDAAVPRRRGGGWGASDPFAPDGKLTVSKVDAVFKSGNATRDTIPTHLVVGRDVPAPVAQFYSHLGPAGVSELGAGVLRVKDRKSTRL